MKSLPSVGFGPTHGYLYIHAAPRAVLKNLEWGIAEVLQMPISLNWEPQPLRSGSQRCQVSWSGIQGSGSRLVSSLKGWHYITFELFESTSQGSDGSLYMYTPELGLFRGTINPHGDLVINENQIQRVLSENQSASISLEEIENLLGRKWDEALDPFRQLSLGGADVDARLSV